jgi:hypothetical protein
MVMARLRRHVKAALSSKIFYAQITHYRKIFYTLRETCKNYKKGETWHLNCVIIHNTDYFKNVSTIQ